MAAEEPTVEETIEGEEIEVEEHLKEAFEGSLRLKRLLTRDDDGPAGKKPKLHIFGPAETAKVNVILTKWAQATDNVLRHVLEQLPMEELTDLEKSTFRPDPNSQWKSAAELCAKYVVEARERKFIDGGPQDSIKSFLHRWKSVLQVAGKPTAILECDKLLRALSHQSLRHVLETFDGSGTLQESIEQAAGASDDIALPENKGIPMLSRFSRLEIIDPLADCAVFGDANLTFSIKLAKHRKALGHVGRVIATTFEELETLRERYKEIDQSIAALEEHYAEVFHGVDCTRIAVDPKFQGMEGSLGAVYYNFPHSGAIQGFFDSHPVVNWRHENLMRLFFCALRPFVKPGGLVKVSSNQGAVGVRYSYIVGAALENEFLHMETMPFLEWGLHRYGRSYGDKRDTYKRPDAVKNESYNAQAANRDMVYCFKYNPTGEPLPQQMVRLPPTLKTIMACTDGPFKNVVGPARQTLAQNLHQRFVTEISGTHVG